MEVEALKVQLSAVREDLVNSNSNLAAARAETAKFEADLVGVRLVASEALERYVFLISRLGVLSGNYPPF